MHYFLFLQKLHPDGTTCLTGLYYHHYVFYYKLTTPLFCRESREAAAFAAIASLRLQDPLHPLKSLHKLQRSPCSFQPLKVQGRTRLVEPPTTVPCPVRLPACTIESTNYSANLQCSFKADFLKKYVGSMSLGPWDKRNTVQMA